jgi:hypothetical protein
MHSIEKVFSTLTIIACLLSALPTLADEFAPPQGYGTGAPRITSDGRTAAETSHMVRNADLYNQQLTKMWARSKKSKGITRITFMTDHVGNMFDLKILLSCGKPVVDNEALKSVGSMVPMRDFGGKSNVNYLFESVFSVDHVKTEFKGRKPFEMPFDDRPLRRGRY